MAAERASRADGQRARGVWQLVVQSQVPGLEFSAHFDLVSFVLFTGHSRVAECGNP
jgi:hypothetical protein